MLARPCSCSRGRQHVSLVWGQRCRCCTLCGRAGAREMKGCSLPGAAGRVKAQWNTWALSDPSPAEAELQLGLTAVAMGYLVSFGHELPSDFGHDLPGGFGHGLPNEFVHELPSGFGHDLPSDFVHELPGEFVPELPSGFVPELPGGFGVDLGKLLRPAKHMLLPWLKSLLCPCETAQHTPAREKLSSHIKASRTQRLNALSSPLDFKPQKGLHCQALSWSRYSQTFLLPSCSRAVLPITFPAACGGIPGFFKIQMLQALTLVQICPCRSLTWESSFVRRGENFINVLFMWKWYFFSIVWVMKENSCVNSP